MQKIIQKTILLSAVFIGLLFLGTAVLAAQSPTSNAGPDLYVDSNQTITLQGSGYDPQSSSLNYYWNCSGGTLSSYTIAQPTYTAPSASQTTYNCSLTVTNTYGLSSTDSMVVNVNYNNQNGSYYVQTNSATSVLNNSASLNGYLSGSSYNTYVWFQWGTTTNYGNTTSQQTLNYSGSFNQNINGLSSNTMYHFRAVAQSANGIIYGQDMTFNSLGYSTGLILPGNLSVSKKVINLTSGNISWQTAVNASPGDILSFAIILQAGGQDVHNVFVQDILPAGLIYRGNLMVNASLNYSGDPSTGINVGTMPANGVEVIAFQVQVAPSASLGYGNITLNNTATITGDETGTQTVNASILVNNALVYGATTLPTGLTNNPITDSFFLPMALIILGSWFYFSGKVYVFADWLETKL